MYAFSRKPSPSRQVSADSRVPFPPVLRSDHRTDPARRLQRAIGNQDLQQLFRGPGQPLEPAVREQMEPRFGYDFSRLRVHTDAEAAEAARALRARAFTVGDDIVFGCGEYAPGTLRGRHLLAHELTHVLQQN